MTGQATKPIRQEFEVRVELRHRCDFVAVAEELSFTRAAQKLRVAHPSLTVQIKLLEEELGVRLLDRGKGRVSLIDEERRFWQMARGCSP